MAKEAVARAQVNPAVLKRLGSAINERRCWVVRCTWPLGLRRCRWAQRQGRTLPDGPPGSGIMNYRQMQAAKEGSGEKINLLAAYAMTPPDAAPATYATIPEFALSGS